MSGVRGRAEDKNEDEDEDDHPAEMHALEADADLASMLPGHTSEQRRARID